MILYFLDKLLQPTPPQKKKKKKKKSYHDEHITKALKLYRD